MEEEHRWLEGQWQQNWDSNKKAFTRNVAENAAAINMTRKWRRRKVVKTTAAKMGRRKKRQPKIWGQQGTAVDSTIYHLDISQHWDA